MTVQTFFATVAAVEFGVMLAFLTLYMLFMGDREERRGRDLSTMPWWWFVGALIGPALATASVYFFVTTH